MNPSPPAPYQVSLLEDPISCEQHFLCPWDSNVFFIHSLYPSHFWSFTTCRFTFKISPESHFSFSAALPTFYSMLSPGFLYHYNQSLSIPENDADFISEGGKFLGSFSVDVIHFLLCYYLNICQHKMIYEDFLPVVLIQDNSNILH